MLIKNSIHSLKTINYRLFISLCAIFLLPTIYQTVRIYFLGNMPSEWGVNIASQIQWVGLIYEVIQEGLILPLFFILGKSLNKVTEFTSKIRASILFTTSIYAFLALIITIFTYPLVTAMGQNITLIDATVTYIRLETIASLFMTIVRLLLIVFALIEKDKYIYVILATQMLVSVLFDTFLISNFNFSLNIGVNGIAISNILSNIILIFTAIRLLKGNQILIMSRNKLDFSFLKEWLKIGSFSGLESLVRNLAFSIMIIRMMNLVTEQGSFWLGNNFIWGWLLLPVLALGDLIRRDVAEDKQNIQTKTLGYISLTTIFIAMWLITIPLWQPFLQHIMNIENYQTVFFLVATQLIFYVVFAYNNILDSTFYGLGKTNYMLYQSLIINVGYYGVAFILYLNGIFKPTLVSIAMLFGIGLLADFIVTLILYLYLIKKMKFKME